MPGVSRFQSVSHESPRPAAPVFVCIPTVRKCQADVSVASADAGHARAASGVVAPFREVDMIGIGRPLTVNHPAGPQRCLMEIECVRERVSLGVVGPKRGQAEIVLGN